MNANTHNLGQLGESAARQFLQKQGYRILDRNWRFHHFELDLVCRDQDCIVFVEVKTRVNDTHGTPIHAITPAKIIHLCKAAMAWLSEHRAWSAPCRFDVVCLTGKPDNFATEHYKDAFPLTRPVGSSHSSWQPW